MGKTGLEAMPAHEKKRCPVCQSEFECKLGSILQCQCQDVYLTPEHLEFITSQYDDCLCASCLRKLRAQYDNPHASTQHLES